MVDRTCQRLNLETKQYETVKVIGRVRFIGNPNGADLTNNKIYNVIGIRNNMLKIIDDTEDYYLYLPQDGNLILKKKAVGAGFVIINDFTKNKEIYKLFDLTREKMIKKENSLKNKILRFIFKLKK